MPVCPQLVLNPFQERCPRTTVVSHVAMFTMAVGDIVMGRPKWFFRTFDERRWGIIIQEKQEDQLLWKGKCLRQYILFFRCDSATGKLPRHRQSAVPQSASLGHSTTTGVYFLFRFCIYFMLKHLLPYKRHYFLRSRKAG